MRKAILIIATAATMLSCTKSIDPLHTPTEHVSFDVSSDIGVHVETRGVTSDLGELQNHGFNIAMVESGKHQIPALSGHVSYVSSSSQWFSDNYLWDKADTKTYDFYAYYPKETKSDALRAEYTVGSAVGNLLSYEMPQNPLKHIDILVADTMGVSDKNRPVKLKFKHITSALTFSEQKKKSEDNVEIEIEKIDIYGLKTHAIYSTTTDTWTEVPGSVHTSIHYVKGESLLDITGTSTVKQNITADNCEMFFPQQTSEDLADLRILVSIKITVPKGSGEEDYVQSSTIEIIGSKKLTDSTGTEIETTVADLFAGVGAGEILDLVLTYSTTTASFTIKGTISPWVQKDIALPDYD